MRILSLLCLSSFLVGCINVNVNLGPPAPGPLQETTLEGEGKQRILLMEISGELSSSAKDGLFGSRESVVSLVHDQLWLARSTDGLKAVVLRINSPGGTVTASDQLHHQIEAFRRETDIPVYTVMMDVAASGGYYVAMATDKVYAQPTTITGSIGVIMALFSVEGLMQKIGVRSEIVKSGENKDMGSPFKEFSPAEREILQSIIDDLYLRFVDVVEAGREELDRERILELADGRVYTASQALEAGLIDGVGYLSEIIARVRAELALEDARLVMFHRPGRHVRNIYSRVDAPVVESPSLVDAQLLESVTPGAGREGFYYLWQP